jgi:hypothetical protein
MTRSSLIVLALAGGFALYVVQVARRRRLHERTVLGWLAIAAVVAALAIWRPGIDRLASWMGIYYAPSALFFICCGGLLWALFRQSVRVAELDARLTRVAQAVTLLSVREPPPRDPAATEPSTPGTAP